MAMGQVKAHVRGAMPKHKTKQQETLAEINKRLLAKINGPAADQTWIAAEV